MWRIVAERIHLVLDGTEKERFRRLAAQAGLSLSEWLRDAAHAKAAAAEAAPSLNSPDALRAFFDECSRREVGQEPDWEVQRELIERSVAGGAADS